MTVTFFHIVGKSLSNKANQGKTTPSPCPVCDAAEMHIAGSDPSILARHHRRTVSLFPRNRFHRGHGEHGNN